MLFLYAMRKLLAYNLPEESIRETVKYIIQSDFVAPLEKKLAEQVNPDAQAQLKTQIELWKGFNFKNLIRAINGSVSKIGIQNKNDLEDWVGDSMVKLYAEREIFSKAIDPATKKPEDLIKFITRFVYRDVFDAARKAYGRSKVDNVGHEKDIMLNIQPREEDHSNLEEFLGGKRDDAGEEEFNEIFTQLKEYIQHHDDKNGLMMKFFPLWMEAMQHHESPKCKQIVDKLVTETGFAEPTIYAAALLLKKHIAEFFRKELDIALTPSMLTKMKLCSESKLAMEEIIAYKEYRAAECRYVLGGVVADMLSGDFTDPKETVVSIITKK